MDFNNYPTFGRHGHKMRADTGGVERIVRGDLVLPDVGDAHELSPLSIVFNVDPMLHISWLANADNLFGMTLASRRPLCDTGGGLIGMEVGGSSWRCRSITGK